MVDTTTNTRHYLPVEWCDDDRMAVLFKPLPLNGQSAARTAKVNFWTAAVHEWTRQTGRLTFTLQCAQHAFLRHSLTPLCLPEVLMLMTQHGSLSPLPLPTATTPESWTSWGARVLAAPPTWAWDRLKPQQGLGHHDQLVDVILLKELSCQVYDSYWRSKKGSSEPSGCCTLSSLYSAVQAECSAVTSDTLRLCVEWLVQQGRAAVLRGQDQLYVRLGPPGCTATQPLTHGDVVEVSLSSSVELLQLRVDQLTAHASALRVRAKRAANDSNRSEALSLLRRRQGALTACKRHLSALDNASTALTTLADARLNREVLSVFRSSTAVLKQLMADTGSADGAADTMDQLQQVLEECSDMSTEIGSSVVAETDADELETELNQLLEQEQSEDQHHGGDPQDQLIQALAELTVPDHNPASPLQQDLSTASLA